MEHGKKLKMEHTTNELTDDIRLCVLKNEKYAYRYTSTQNGHIHSTKRQHEHGLYKLRVHVKQLKSHPRGKLIWFTSLL